MQPVWSYDGQHVHEQISHADSHLQIILQAILNRLSYVIMWRYTESQLAIGGHVIVDCPLARKELYDTGNALALKVCLAIRKVSCTLQPNRMFNQQTMVLQSSS